MAQHPSYADYAYDSQRNAMFDVRWCPFSPQLSLNAVHQQDSVAPSGASFVHPETASLPFQVSIDSGVVSIN